MAHAKHYENVSEIYDQNVFYDVSGPLVQWQLQQVCEKLSLQPGDRIADVGAGTGAFTAEIARWLQEQSATSEKGADTIPKANRDPLPPVTVVEPSAEMLEQARNRGGESLRLRLGTAGDFTSSESRQKEAGCYDKILLKEVMHHIPHDERTEVFRGMFELLSPNGQFCILTRPKEPDYPFFTGAMQHWIDHQDDAKDLEVMLSSAGFQVVTQIASFPIRLAKSTWYSMVRQRYWSNFADFSDQELEAGILEVEQKFPDGDELSFNEVEVFVVATKPSA